MWSRFLSFGWCDVSRPIQRQKPWETWISHGAIWGPIFHESHPIWVDCRTCDPSVPTEIYLAEVCDTLVYQSVTAIQGSRPNDRICWNSVWRPNSSSHGQRRALLALENSLSSVTSTCHAPDSHVYDIPMTFLWHPLPDFIHCNRPGRTASAPIQSSGSFWEAIVDASSLAGGRDYRLCVDQDTQSELRGHMTPCNDHVRIPCNDTM